MTTSRIKGLYAITPDLGDTADLHERVHACLKGGVSVVQYRNKIASPELRREQAASLLALCRTYHVPLIINDHAELCMDIDADGLHVGSDDYRAGELAQLKSALGKHKLLGVSCYNELELAQQAARQGADYIAFGSCFDSGTKPAAVRASLDLFSQAHHLMHIPTVAIGGITLANAAQAIDAGADAIAVINALFAAEDIADTARQFSKLFDE